ncbi:MAG: hypothetical protein ACFFB3_15675 [Candidatus Hodarchaeota archaeon]
MSKSIKRRFSINLGLLTADNHPSGEQRIYITKAASESGVHIALKIIAYAWFFEQNPIIEPRVDYRYRPDLAVFSPINPNNEDIFSRTPSYMRDIGIAEWIECKRTAPKKIRRILRNLDCHLSLFHRSSALAGYQRALSRLLRVNELHRVHLFGVAGDLESFFEGIDAARHILAMKKQDSITFLHREGASIGYFPIEKKSCKSNQEF